MNYKLPLEIGTILKMDGKYVEILDANETSYRITVIEDDYEMPIDVKAIHQGLEKGIWQIVK